VTEPIPTKKRCSKDLTLLNAVGLHLRVAKSIAETANKFESLITLSKEGYTVNAKSVLGLAALFAPKGTVLNCVAKGPDAEDAVQAMQALFESKFGED